MPDTTHRIPQPAHDWHDAFAALPLETPPAGGWTALASKLGTPRRARRTRAPLWFATAAAVLLAVALPWRLQWFEPEADAPRPWPDATPLAAADPYEALYAESAQLESLLAAARDDRVASAPAALMVNALDVDLATIDAALTQPGLSPEDRLALWQQRVDSLRTLATFESSQRWYAAHGTSFQAALARID